MSVYLNYILSFINNTAIYNCRKFSVLFYYITILNYIIYLNFETKTIVGYKSFIDAIVVRNCSIFQSLPFNLFKL